MSFCGWFRHTTFLNRVRCGSDEFRCQSGRCLPKSYLCDGTADCGINGVDDNSDEDPSIWQAPICSQQCQDLGNGLSECECHEDFRPNGSYCDPRKLSNY
ncbi:Low-density lipoprotein receptor domain class A [Cooperia oncophora]